MIPANVSVIIPCYKMGRYVGHALESVGSQIYSYWEVIVVDDAGPEDGTRTTVDAFARRFSANRIEFIRRDRNGGVSAARNTAIASAQGEFLAFLDPDDFWDPRHLSEQVKVLTSNRHVDVAYAGVDFVDKDGTVIGTFKPSDKFIEDFPKPLYCKNEIHLSTVVARKLIVCQVGGFDESPEIQHVEDWDLWIRLALAGAKFERTAAPQVCYRRHLESASADDSKMLQRSVNLMKKHHTEFRVVEALYLNCHRLEIESQQLQGRYDGLKSIYNRTIDRRSKNLVKKLLGRKSTSDGVV